MSERPPEDGPLGFDADDRDQIERWAHRQDPDLVADGITASRPDTPPPAPRPPAGISRYSWFVGVVFLLLIALVTVNTVSHKGPGSRGLEAGTKIPPFAAPLALSDLEGDVNTATKPDQGKAGKVPACSLHGPRVLNVCDLYRDRPLVLAFFATRSGKCTQELDTLERVRARHPGVSFAAIAIRGDRGEVRDLIRSHGWRFPVGYDHDGALANLYGVAICPQLTYVRRGGTVAATGLGEAGEQELERRVSQLEKPTRRSAA